MVSFQLSFWLFIYLCICFIIYLFTYLTLNLFELFHHERQDKVREEELTEMLRLVLIHFS